MRGGALIRVPPSTEIELLSQHGTMLPTEMVGLTDEQVVLYTPLEYHCITTVLITGAGTEAI